MLAVSKIYFFGVESTRCRRLTFDDAKTAVTYGLWRGCARSTMTFSILINHLDCHTYRKIQTAVGGLDDSESALQIPWWTIKAYDKLFLPFLPNGALNKWCIYWPWQPWRWQSDANCGQCIYRALIWKWSHWSGSVSVQWPLKFKFAFSAIFQRLYFSRSHFKLQSF